MTESNYYVFKYWSISTHILTKRMTFYFHVLSPVLHISTHILTKRMTKITCNPSVSNNISTHILTKRMTNFVELKNLVFDYFNSHPHEEDDCHNTLSPFLLYSYFNSHPHEEDDCSNQSCQTNDLNFNSHPHEEDDNAHGFQKWRTNISTHILTKRMTMAGKNTIQNVGISTHILTKRMTVHLLEPGLMRYFNSHPHEEDDAVHHTFLQAPSHFNSHPHEEDDNMIGNVVI